MTSVTDSVDCGSARVKGERLANSIVRTSMTDTLWDAAALWGGMFNTPCCFQAQSAQRPILTSMEHRSYVKQHVTTSALAIAMLLTILICSMPASAQAQSETVELTLISSHQHDSEAFTQGLEMHNGLLYESTGLYGHSSLREVDPLSGQVIRQTELDESLFAEGITIVGDNIVMLTWKEGVALVFDIESMTVVANHTYAGEGWGLCYDGTHLVMSNGTSELAFRNPEDFTLTSTLRVTDQGNEVSQLNELECVGQTVYANIWGSDSIIAIDKSNGEVGLTIDVSMLAENESDGYNNVLNGIAYVPEQDAFLITGKNWTSMHLVSFGDTQDTQDTQDEESLESLGESILKSIWPVLLVTALVIFLSSMRFLSVIMQFIILMVVKRQTEQPPMPSEEEQEAGEGQ
jgi:glutaminyl-peptide cyclotransferase